MEYLYEQKGSLYSKDFRIFLKNADTQEYISPVHDIPLWHNEGDCLANMIVEIPRWTNAKLEISSSEPLNPIQQDVDSDGNLRYVANTFPSHGYMWNYGALPQTWEDPNHTDSSTKCKGDGDPVDVIDIGTKVHQSGEVVQVKILGNLAMIDEGQTDWKVVSIDATDSMAHKLSDISDVDVYMPELIKTTIQWFKVYKMADGKPANKFAFNGRAKNKSFTLNVLREANQQWCSMMASKKDLNFCRTHTSLLTISKKSIIGQEAAKEIVAKCSDLGPDEEITNDKVYTWHHISQM